MVASVAWLLRFVVVMCPSKAEIRHGSEFRSDSSLSGHKAPAGALRPGGRGRDRGR
ncbi:hypothetical protein SAMN05216267_102571 [Actinacidiphila rubida]|uniref:Uncharacterized protein n=1 Tax=Actinacidiphila rubida TaxID=310780 RepID=A0A1H8PEA3_9ACTN|nr:hypothetical protein SAMN05216267_102571 [Actinacidiphila rubida]